MVEKRVFDGARLKRELESLMFTRGLDAMLGAVRRTDKGIGAFRVYHNPETSEVYYPNRILVYDSVPEAFGIKNLERADYDLDDFDAEQEGLPIPDRTVAFPGANLDNSVDPNQLPVLLDVHTTQGVMLSPYHFHSLNFLRGISSCYGFDSVVRPIGMAANSGESTWGSSHLWFYRENTPDVADASKLIGSYVRRMGAFVDLALESDISDAEKYELRKVAVEAEKIPLHDMVGCLYDNRYKTFRLIDPDGHFDDLVVEDGC